MKHLFPFIESPSPGHERLLDVLLSLEAENARDIMNSTPSFVYEETPVTEAVELMVAEQVNELPVVNSQRQVMGEINFLEIISAYLKAERGGRSDAERPR